jgi:hypothetical protein
MITKIFFKLAGTAFGLCVGLLLLLLFSLPSPARAADKTLILLPLVFYADESKAYLRQGLKTMLTSRLSGEGLELIRDQAFTPFLSETEKQGISSQKRAEELARQVEAHYAVFGSITSVGTGFSLDLAILDLTQDEPELTRVSEAVSEDQLIAKLDDVAYDFRAIIAGTDIRKQKVPVAVREEERAKGFLLKASGESYTFKPTGRFSLKVSVMALDTGDLNGDGTTELVVLDRETLMVYNRKEQSLQLKDSLKTSMGEDFLRVSVGDIDRNGKAEIYLVGYQGSRASSAVYEWTGKFKRIDRRPGHLHVAKHQGGSRSLLLFQESNLNHFFAGEIWVMDYQGGKLTKKDPIPGLKGAQLYTLTLFDLGRDGKTEFLGLGQPGLDEGAFIHVWDLQGNLLWQGVEKVGRTNNAIRWGKAYPGEQPPRISFNARLVITDVDEDGKKEVLAATNTPMVKHMDFKVYVKGNITVYRIDGTSLIEAYKTKNIGYCITDMQTEGQTLYLAAQKGKIAKFGKRRGRIMWFE